MIKHAQYEDEKSKLEESLASVTSRNTLLDGEKQKLQSEIKNLQVSCPVISKRTKRGGKRMVPSFSKILQTYQEALVCVYEHTPKGNL